MGALSVLWEQFGVKDLIDILVVAFIFYHTLFIIHGTRAVQMLVGLGMLFVLFWLGLTLQLHSLNWLLSHFFEFFIIILVILFQDQIRTALSNVGGGKNILKIFTEDDEDLDMEEIVEAMGALSRENVGALVVLERSNGLQNYINTGTRLKSQVHSDVLYAIFQSSGPLHDGAVIVSDGLLTAAGCFLPLSKNVEIDRHLGTRHRAALGITEISDAVVITVSEETGNINVCLNGIFYACDNESILRQYLKHLWLNDKLDESLEPLSDIGEGKA